jgi:hypothetical protein
MNIGPATILLGDAAESLRSLPADSVDVIITSPPFFALRSYLKAGDPLKPLEIGSEDTPEKFLGRLMAVFDECRRVLKPTGVCYVEFGDSYDAGCSSRRKNSLHGDDRWANEDTIGTGKRNDAGIGAGELLNIPHRFAESMRSRGWRWRSTCVWLHRSAMPESLGGWRWERCKVKVKAGGSPARNLKPELHVGAGLELDDTTDFPVKAVWSDCPGCPKCLPNGGYVLRKGQWRCTTGHSYVFMFAKTDEYYSDATAASEPASSATVERNKYTRVLDDPDEQYAVAHDHEFTGSTRNPRTVWTDIANEPMSLDACLSCGRVWKAAEKKKELRKKGKEYVCTCGAADWGSHYAAFPSSLVRKCLTPHISRAGCCAACGVPWSPVVEKQTPPAEAFSKGRGQIPDSIRADGAVRTSPTKDGKASGQKLQDWLDAHPPIISGFRPSCSCKFFRLRDDVPEPIISELRSLALL